jgi:hypothetical protein
MPCKSDVAPKPPPDDLVRLRNAVQGTIATAVAMGLLTQPELEELSNQTIDAMSAETLLALSELAGDVQILLRRESVVRQHARVRARQA